MKIYMEKANRLDGPSIFQRRLISAFHKYTKVKVTHNVRDNFSCELAFISSKSRHRKPVVLRLDGCYTRVGDKGRNRPILESIKRSKHIVYQSHYSRDVFQNFLNVDKENTVIYNGIDLDLVESIKPREDIERGSFVSVASWRNNKRPLSTVNGFLRADTGKKLYVIGDGFDGIKNENVIFLGKIEKEEKIISVLKSCSYMIHLCYMDSCPNSVIEGLSCGLNVLCSNLGGTKEIVGNCGIVLDIDSWDFKEQKETNLDNVDLDVISYGIKELMNIEQNVLVDRFSVRNTALSYEKVLQKWT